LQKKYRQAIIRKLVPMICFEDRFNLLNGLSLFQLFQSYY